MKQSFLSGGQEHSPSVQNSEICTKTPNIDNSISRNLSFGKVVKPKYLTMEELINYDLSTECSMATTKTMFLKIYNTMRK